MTAGRGKTVTGCHMPRQTPLLLLPPIHYSSARRQEGSPRRAARWAAGRLVTAGDALPWTGACHPPQPLISLQLVPASRLVTTMVASVAPACLSLHTPTSCCCNPFLQYHLHCTILYPCSAAPQALVLHAARAIAHPHPPSRRHVPRHASAKVASQPYTRGRLKQRGRWGVGGGCEQHTGSQLAWACTDKHKLNRVRLDGTTDTSNSEMA